MYLDGEASAEDRALIEEHLRRCEACASRADLYDRTRRALRAAALEEDEAALPGGFEERLRRSLSDVARPSSGSLFVRASPFAAAGVALCVAVAAWVKGDDPTTAPVPVVQRTIEHHTLDVPVDVASPDAAYVARFLGSRVGHKVAVPRLDVAGYGLAGGRVVSLDDRRAAQLVYRGGLGRRLSVMAVPDPDGRLARQMRRGHSATASRDPSVLFRGEEGGFNVEVLAHDGTVYSLVGDKGEARGLDLAKSLSLASYAE